MCIRDSSYTWAKYMNDASVASGAGIWFTDEKLEQIKTFGRLFPRREKSLVIERSHLVDASVARGAGIWFTDRCV